MINQVANILYKTKQTDCMTVTRKVNSMLFASCTMQFPRWNLGIAYV